MAVSKVILNGTTLIDVTDDTVASSNLLSGYTATGADGETVSGAYIAPTFVTQSKNVTPIESAQAITADSGYDALSLVNVAAISSNYIGTAIARRSVADLTASGSIVSGPIGYYSEAFSKAVSAGSIMLSGTSFTLNVTPVLNSYSACVSVAARIATEEVSANVVSGYISNGISSVLDIRVSGSIALPSLAAQTITPTTTDQIISKYQWLTGSQTILGDPNLLASNIKSGVSIFGVQGTLEPSGGAGAITIIDTPDPHGGTVRTVTAVDISADTISASDLAYGVTAHASDGTAITGTLSIASGVSF